MPLCHPPVLAAQAHGRGRARTRLGRRCTRGPGALCAVGLGVGRDARNPTWDAGGGVAASPRQGLSGLSRCQAPESCLCVGREAGPVSSGVGVGPPPCPQPPHPGLPAPAPPQLGQRAGSRCQEPSVPPEDRALAGVRTVTEAAARPGVGSLFIPGCGAGASVTPTLWMGTPRPSGRRELARSQGSEAAEPGGPGLACRLPTGLHSAARPRRLPGGSASSRQGPW